MILVPQSIAYAKLAGLPPVYGLYAAFLPPVVAAFFGSSRQLATVNLLVPPGTDLFVTYSVALARLVGIARPALGLLRLGVLVDLLSSPVVVGFTNGAVLIIASSQLQYIFGVKSSGDPGPAGSGASRLACKFRRPGGSWPSSRTG